MINTYSKRSLENLKTCDLILQYLFTRVLEGFDHSITEGYRGKVVQDRYFKEGKSKLQWPDSGHNNRNENDQPCSLAVHALPYPKFDWGDRERFHYFAGHVIGVAKEFGIPLIWGGDWRRNGLLNKNNYAKPFDDLAHYEIRL